MTRQAILITGVSTGIGLGCSRAFIDGGFHVYGSVRKQADADKLKQELGEHFTPVIFDVTDAEAIDAAAASLTKQLGKTRLAGLINNAGIATSGPLLEQPLDELRYQFEVNVIGQLKVIQAFFPLLTNKHADGAPARVIMMSSVAAGVSPPFLGAYSASKRALEGLTDSLRRELMLFGIDIVIVGPGKVASAIWEKPSATDMSRFVGTVWEKPVAEYQALILKKGNTGDPIDKFGQRVLRVFNKRRPKTRHAIVKGKLLNWTLPRLLPARLLDKKISSMFKLSPDEQMPEGLPNSERRNTATQS